MKKIVRIASILSRINLVVWGLICAFGLLLTVGSGNWPLVVGAFLLSSVVLHSYAALQLQKSIRNPAIPLGSQTSTGIRFVGVAALFFGVMYIAYGMAIIRHPQDIFKTMQSSSMPQIKEITVGQVRACGAIFLLLGLSITINVILNFRLLRWYHMSKANEDRP
jgi:hypothetical protein